MEKGREHDLSENKNTQQELAYELYLQGYKYADIAEQVGCSLSAVKSWATRIWKNKKSCKEKLQPKQEKVAKKLQPKKYKHGMHPNSHRNGTGPPGNKNSEKHGFYAKVLPKETLELFNELEDLNPIDILWHNIKTQYAIILRAQKIMYVKDINDSDKDIIAEGENVTSYRVTKAWEKQANLLQAQSRAVVALNGLIKQYDEMLKGDLVTEERLARIEMLKAKINVDTNEVVDDGFLEALNSNTELDWEDYDKETDI